MSGELKSNGLSELLESLSAFEMRLDRLFTVDELKSCMADISKVEALLPKAKEGLTSEEFKLLSKRIASVKSKNRKKLNEALPWPMVVFSGKEYELNEAIELLEHPNHWVRCQAAKELRKILEGEKEDRKKDTIVVLNEIFKLRSHAEADIRWHAIDLMLRIPRKTITDSNEKKVIYQWLCEAGNDAESVIRSAALRGMTKVNDKGVQSVLSSIANKDQEKSLRDQAQRSIRGKQPYDKKHCTICKRVLPPQEVCLVSTYSISASEDYTFFSLYDYPFLDLSTIVNTNFDPSKFSTWRTFKDITMSQSASLLRETYNNVKKKKGEDWDRADSICHYCATAVGFTSEEIEKARAAAIQHPEGGNGTGFLTEHGQAFKKHVTGSCFVCTVAFDDPYAPEVKVFRDFRDACLAKSWWGENLIEFYYAWGPFAAKLVASVPLLRSIVRIFLKGVLPFVRWRMELDK